MKIVHYEDEKMLNDMYHKKFVDMGFEHRGFMEPPEDREDLVNQVLEERADIVITDIIHKSIDGLELARILKGDSRTSKIPIVILTNNATEDIIEMGKKTGVDEYLVKSQVVPSEVVDRVKKLYKKYIEGKTFRN